MAILRAMDGKFYDVPDDQATKFEVPRDKVKELLEKSGGPAPQSGPGGGPGPGYGGPPSPGGQVIVQIFAGGAPDLARKKAAKVAYHADRSRLHRHPLLPPLDFFPTPLLKPLPCPPLEH